MEENNIIHWIAVIFGIISSTITIIQFVENVRKKLKRNDIEKYKRYLFFLSYFVFLLVQFFLIFIAISGFMIISLSLYKYNAILGIIWMILGGIANIKYVTVIIFNSMYKWLDKKI